MSKNVAAGSVKSRPTAPSSKSFTRFEPPTSPTASSGRIRATTVPSPVASRKSQDEERADVFNKTENEEEEPSPILDKTSSLPDRFDELPIELASLTDRFGESLNAKTYNEPPSIDQIADLFQEFYTRASASISIHVSALRSKLNRDLSPTPSKGSSRSRPLSKKQSSDSLAPPDKDGSQQMLTASEVTERRKQRRLLEYKKLVLEEAVERRACENVYDKIWRHKSTLDEVRDEKLRSKTAALALVGIGLKDLGVELDVKSDKTIEDVQEALGPAREGLMKMNEERYPLGKLQHLTAAHKVIVETLSSIHGSSSSADEILPTLIYTLIISPVEGINIISNLYFIQRFRGTSRIDGEAAYCLTNLEAAIGFLEDVDLATLRADELPEGPKRPQAGPQTPTTEKPEPFPAFTGAVPMGAPTVTTTSSSAAAVTSTIAKDKIIRPSAVALPSPRHQRTLSDLLKPVQNANEAVRSTAREGIENISNTLDNSFKFLFGRLKEHSADSSRPDDITVPKTLDEARQLVTRPLGPEAGEDGTAISDTSSIAGDAVTESPPAMEKERSKSGGEDKLLSLFGGRKAVQAREQSLDRESIKSNSSGKKVAFATTGSGATISQLNDTTSGTVSPTGNPLESVKNFGSSLNPLSHIGNALGAGFKGFGRQPVSSPLVTARKENDRPLENPVKAEDAEVEEPKVAIFMDKPEAISEKIKSVSPPIRRFMEIGNAEELKIKDINELLTDYQRLAHLLNELASASASDELEKDSHV